MWQICRPCEFAGFCVSGVAISNFVISLPPCRVGCIATVAAADRVRSFPSLAQSEELFRFGNLAGLRSGNGLVDIEYAQYDSELIVGTTQALTGISTPAAVSGLSSVTAIHAGVSFGVALKSDGTVWAWGENASGQLGNGTSSNSSTPVRSQGGGL